MLGNGEDQVSIRNLLVVMTSHKILVISVERRGIIRRNAEEVQW
jgi:hypothetical protein